MIQVSRLRSVEGEGICQGVLQCFMPYATMQVALAKRPISTARSNEAQYQRAWKELVTLLSWPWVKMRPQGANGCDDPLRSQPGKSLNVHDLNNWTFGA
jgi:hypothetical protein